MLVPKSAVNNQISVIPFMLVTTKQLYEVAYGKFAVGAYNVNNME